MTVFSQKLKIFYNPNQSVAENKSDSPSAGKPKKFIEQFHFISDIDICSDFSPLTLQQLKYAHDPNHVDSIMECRKNNGFGNKQKDIANSLLWTNGSFYAAAKHAYTNKTITCSPTSGFHHAEYDASMGFCTFNGLIIAAILLKKEFESQINKIGIVDIDAHYGNGTDNIIDNLKIDYIEHYTFGEHVERIYKRAKDGLFNSFLTHLKHELETKFKDSDIIFYQSGADPHINDPYGGYLTTEELRIRDQVVFEFAAINQIPIVWNLAGGYQTPFENVLEIHNNTVKECLKTLQNYKK
jgi:acetoin utilization deacetylase AcuC-like enzyme